MYFVLSQESNRYDINPSNSNEPTSQPKSQSCLRGPQCGQHSHPFVSISLSDAVVLLVVSNDCNCSTFLWQENANLAKQTEIEGIHISLRWFSDMCIPLPNWQICCRYIHQLCSISVEYLQLTICYISVTYRNLAPCSYLSQICDRYWEGSFHTYLWKYLHGLSATDRQNMLHMQFSGAWL